MNLHRKLSWTLLLLALAVLFSCSGQKSGSGTNSVTAKRVGAAAILTSDIQVSTSPFDQSQPAVAFDTVNHQYMTVWTDARNSSSGSLDIYGRIMQARNTYADGIPRFDNTTTTKTGISVNWVPASTDLKITSSTTASPTPPKIAFYPDPVDSTKSKYLIVWTDTRNSYSQIFGQFVRADGTLLLRDAVTPSMSGSANVPDNFVITEHVGNSLPAGTVTVKGQYKSPTSNGSISINSTTPTQVVGTNTTFLSKISTGDIFVINNVAYTVASVTDDNNLTLTSPYIFPTGVTSLSNLSYLSYSFDSASSSVTGNGTNFTKSGLTPGDKIQINGIYYQVASIATDTSLTLTSSVLGYSGTYSYTTTSHLSQSSPDLVYNPIYGNFVLSWIDTSDWDNDNTL
ncbi:MAG TPA: hypothetical protein VJ604_12110, partial [Geomonas sp.]|nr:hypothetical protein [Geomonas sp.]